MSRPSGELNSDNRLFSAMVYVFKTSVKTRKSVGELKPGIMQLALNLEWNFDLEDSDKILRIDSDEITAKQVIDLLTTFNFECRELE